MRSHWCTAFDLDLIETRREKMRLLARAADEGWLILWAHDPQIAASRIRRDADGQFVPADQITVL